MEVPKPKCYDSVPVCLCRDCQRYDVYMASCVPRTFAQSTSGLAVVDAARSRFADAHSRGVRCKPARSSPVAVSSSAVSVVVSKAVSSHAPFGSLARSSAVAVSSSPVAARPVTVVVSSPVSSRSSVSVSPARSSTVVVSSSPVAARPVTVSSVVSSPVSSRNPVSVSPVRSSPVVVPSVLSGPAGPGSTVSSSARPVSVPPVWPRSTPRLVRPCAQPAVSVGPLFGRPACFSFVPMVCFVLAVPVLLSSPFGLVLSFLPVWR